MDGQEDSLCDRPFPRFFLSPRWNMLKPFWKHQIRAKNSLKSPAKAKWSEIKNKIKYINRNEPAIRSSTARSSNMSIFCSWSSTHSIELWWNQCAKQWTSGVRGQGVYAILSHLTNTAVETMYVSDRNKKVFSSSHGSYTEHIHEDILFEAHKICNTPSGSWSSTACFPVTCWDWRECAKSQHRKR